MQLMAKAIRHVFITDPALLRVVMIASRRGPDETGGPMVGYMTVDEALVVTNVAGPGLHGLTSRVSVTIDGAHATRFTAEETERSGGRVRYVGDWHVHPGEDVSPSPTDRSALRLLPARNDWGYPVVSLIFSASLQQRKCFHRTRWSHRTVNISLQIKINKLQQQ